MLEDVPVIRNKMKMSPSELWFVSVRIIMVCLESNQTIHDS